MLGQMQAQYWQDGSKGVAQLPDPLPEELTVTRTAYGEIEHPSPIPQYSETPSYWRFLRARGCI